MVNVNANIICDIKSLSNEEWLKIREHACVTPDDPESEGWVPYTVTGSAVSAILGVNPWKSNIEYYNEKVGIHTVAEEHKNEEILRAGHEAEEFVARMFARKLREDFPDLKSIEIIDDTNMYQHRKYPHMIADCDRFVKITLASGKVLFAGVECKTTRSKKTKEEFKNGIVPANYEWQCRHYEAVTDVDYWYICACWGFTIDECAVCLIKRDKEIEEKLIAAENEFVEACKKGVPPKPNTEYAEQLNAYYNRLYGGLPEGEDGKIVLTESEEAKQIFADAEGLDALYKKKKNIEEEIAVNEALIVANLITLTNGKGSYIELRKDNEHIQAIKLKVPHKRDSVDIKKIETENPILFEECKKLGAAKVTKTDLGKMKIDGAKINPAPYVISGAVNTDEPISFGGLETIEKLA